MSQPTTFHGPDDLTIAEGTINTPRQVSLFSARSWFTDG